MGTAETQVNSFHHQAVRDVKGGCIVTATSPDGVIEGIELTDKPVVGVQWHPEELYAQHPEQRALFEWLIS